jgi:hypothetical protein
MTLPKLSALGLLSAAACFAGTYSWDDGAGAFSTLSQSKGVLLVGYQVTPGNETIAGMDYRHFWNVANGHAITFHLWTDPSNDGNPTDAQVQRSVVTTVASPTASGGFQRIQFASPLALNVGDWFYVGHSFVDPDFAFFLSTADESAPIAGNSWQYDWNTIPAVDPNNLASAADVYHYNAHDVMIHGLTESEFAAAPVPEPGTTILFSCGLAACWICRRRLRYSSGRAS